MMKFTLRHTALLAVAFALTSTLHAATARVNVNPSSTVDFMDLQSAHDAALPGDTILVEGNLQFFGESFYADYAAIITKPLVILGPGYFLDQNFPVPEPNDAVCSSILIAVGAANTVIKGLCIQDLQIDEGIITVANNKIAHTAAGFVFNLIFEGNFMKGNTPFVPVLSLDGVGSSVFSHNIILHDSGFTSGQFSVFDINSFGNEYNHNLIGDANSVISQGFIHNNIFKQHSFEDIDGCVFNNNIFDFSAPPVLPNDPGGDPNDPSVITDDPSNILGVDLLTVFVGGPSPDAQFDLIPGSPATGNADDGLDVGPFTFSPESYLPSGVSIPVLAFMNNSPSTFESHLLPFNGLAFDPEGVSQITNGEYYIDFINNQPGEGIPFSFQPGTSVDFFPAADVLGLPPGVHILGVRVQNEDNEWSFPIENTFNVPQPDELPFLSNLLYSIDSPNDFSGAVQIENPIDLSEFGEFLVTYNLSPLEPGIHMFSFRTVDSNGAESTTYTLPFLVSADPEELPTLVEFEYFFDEDPGYGQAQPFPITPGLTVFDGTVLLDLMDEEIGPHELFIRLKDTDGAYSTSYNISFYVISEEFALVDMNGDCMIDISDLLPFLGDFGCDEMLDPPCPGDFNGDGQTNTGDLLIFLGYYGSSCDDQFGAMGCTDPAAVNFDPAATIDDGSCCFDNYITINMFDSFQDGWGGATFVITEQVSGDVVLTGTLDDGATGSLSFCAPDGCYVIEVGGGMFDSEISWELVDQFGTILLVGAAPEIHSFGVNIPTCPPPQ